MNISFRNITLILLFFVIQYQIWYAHGGYNLTRELSEEVHILSRQYERMQNLTHKKYTHKDPTIQTELLEEQARETYHYVASGEQFVAFSSPIFPRAQGS